MPGGELGTTNGKTLSLEGLLVDLVPDLDAENGRQRLGVPQGFEIGGGMRQPQILERGAAGAKDTLLVDQTLGQQIGEDALGPLRIVGRAAKVDSIAR